MTIRLTEAAAKERAVHRIDGPISAPALRRGRFGVFASIHETITAARMFPLPGESSGFDHRWRKLSGVSITGVPVAAL
jgi:hypothetical protein